MNLAPIVLFAYNRPDHTKKTLNALAINPESIESELFIYCDGPKSDSDITNLNKIDQVKDIAKREDRFKKVNVIIHKRNKGLAKSIVDGVTDVINKYGKVIVLEDDIVTSKGFLRYMNDALIVYQNNSKVMHVSGYMYPHKEELPETFFFNVPLCWGWATWKSAWDNINNDCAKLWEEIIARGQLYNFDKFGGDYLSSQLAYNITGKLNTWFIKWHASVFLNDGFSLYPKNSLIENIGFDNTGVHNGTHYEFKNKELTKSILVEEIELNENLDAKRIIKDFYKILKQKPEGYNLKGFLKNKLKNIVLSIFPNIKKAMDGNNKISLKRTYLGHNCKIYPNARMNNTIIGNFSYISENSIINNTIIGKFCSIGPNLISGWGTHPTIGISTHPMFYSTGEQNKMTLSSENKTKEFLPINIGNDVFIGMNVTILDGVSIGDGAIIGAGAVVSKDIPNYAIAVGNPIKIIKYRFDPDIIKKLNKVKWWNFKYEDLTLIEKYFFDINEFLNVIEIQSIKTEDN